MSASKNSSSSRSRSTKSKAGRSSKKESPGESRSTSDGDVSLQIGPGMLIGFLLLILGSGFMTYLLIQQPWKAGSDRAVQDLSESLGSPNERSVPTALSFSNKATAPTREWPARGAADAPVQIIEFSDYQCPNCRQFATKVMPYLDENWIQKGLVRVEWRDFAIRGERSESAAHAAHCANEQDQFWAYHDGLFDMSGGPGARVLDTEAFEDLARSIGLSMPAFEACQSSGRYLESVRSSSQAAIAEGFEGTPTFLINVP